MDCKDVLSCSCVFQIRAQGAQVIGAVIGQLSNLVGLDLTDNGLDADLAKLLAWVQVRRERYLHVEERCVLKM